MQVWVGPIYSILSIKTLRGPDPPKMVQGFFNVVRLGGYEYCSYSPLGVIVLTKGKPLWAFLKQFWTFVSKWVAENSDSIPPTICMLYMLAYFVSIKLLFPENTDVFILGGLGMVVVMIIFLVSEIRKDGLSWSSFSTIRVRTKREKDK